MSTKSLALLLAIYTAISTSAGAETAEQLSAPLPQFVPPTQRQEIAPSRQEKGPVSAHARQAAEELSGKFSDGQSAAIKGDQPIVRQTDSHVAVLVAPSSKRLATAKTKLRPKNLSPQGSGSTLAKRAVESKVQRISARSLREAGADSPIKFASGLLPGADAGWRTGIIGMLTNPTFWHASAKPEE